MINLEKIASISIPSPSKIVFIVIDGLGGLPHPATGKTELETANTPNLDRLAGEGNCGLVDPVGPGITPGSAPGHLALFGYDPVEFLIGRGVLEAVGIGIDLKEGDVAARGNLCQVDERGVIIDRRAGRISTEKCAELCQLLSRIELDGAQLVISPVKEHRFVVIFRGEGLSADLSDSDPQQTGVVPKTVTPLSPPSEKAAAIANEFISQARKLLQHHPANMVLLRGFASRPHFPYFSEVYKLKPVALATYPMYRGLARLVGMEVIDAGSSLEDEFTALSDHYEEYDFFFLHIKEADVAGEDGDFERKVRVIEEVDVEIQRVISLDPDVVVVTADHSTPASLKGHSWHPVPFLLYSRWCRPDGARDFSERACAAGGLGRFPGVEVMPLVMGYSRKLTKFGA
jgi:2,3-bisphosphoglycerate-independent phosphoglycerate mutase